MTEDWASRALPAPPITPLRWRGGWRDGALELLDQTRLPRDETWLTHRAYTTVVDDIVRLAVRGAPVIGIAGAYALVLAAREVTLAEPAIDVPTFFERLTPRAERIATARPTAVNLGAAVRAGLRAARACPGGNPEQITDVLLEAAMHLDAYEREACEGIARHGAAWLDGRTRFLTHCNAGALVTTGLGTALAPLYALHAAGREIQVYADETRPLLQGLRLTAYELARGGVPVQVIADGAAAGLIAEGHVDAVIVGADRVSASGDVANKVGTYGLALAADRHGIPFVVAAPLTTIDRGTVAGADIPIEQRPDDVGRYVDPACLPSGLETWAPAFDRTPAALVSALVTERGVVERPDATRIETLFATAP
ncbi:MAG: S-methyl-5-thioribose-1-phosphate isomerase [Planctomycetota bacterium]|nr:S-methyl-5-thioribose-1-phosphate isomerase [Planctomycetota bacterium]